MQSGTKKIGCLSGMCAKILVALGETTSSISGNIVLDYFGFLSRQEAGRLAVHEGRRYIWPHKKLSLHDIP